MISRSQSSFTQTNIPMSRALQRFLAEPFAKRRSRAGSFILLNTARVNPRTSDAWQAAVHPVRMPRIRVTGSLPGVHIAESCRSRFLVDGAGDGTIQGLHPDVPARDGNM